MKDYEQLKGLTMAHRGVYDNHKIPENSLTAFKEALRKNIAIELDVHLLKDGNIVVFHDDNLKRMTGISKKIKDCTYEELKKLYLLSTKEKIPLLKEVLTLINGKVLLNIEIKFDTKVGKIEEQLIKQLDTYQGKFVIQTFDPRHLRWFKKNRPNYYRGLLVTNYRPLEITFYKKWFMQNMHSNFLTQPDFISYHKNALPNNRVTQYRKKGHPVFTWLIENKQELKKMEPYADSFIIDGTKLKEHFF